MGRGSAREGRMETETRIELLRLRVEPLAHLLEDEGTHVNSRFPVHVHYGSTSRGEPSTEDTQGDRQADVHCPILSASRFPFWSFSSKQGSVPLGTPGPAYTPNPGSERPPLPTSLPLG